MRIRKFLNLLLAAMMVFSLVGVHFNAAAMPMNPTDESKVPHYFGPYPNWANSPYTLPDVAVEIIGDGQGAKATASVGANGSITGITVTDPGTGYSQASVNITGAGSGAAATAQVTISGIVTEITVGAAGSGYVQPVVTISGGGGAGTLVQVGNPLVDRAYATDYDAATPVPVFVVVPTPLPTGTLTEFRSLNQALAAGSPTPSAGQIFNAYVLRPTGNLNEYNVVFDSGTLTVPALADPAISEVVNYPVGNVPVHAGDVLAFYGAGIPVDIDPAGADIFSFPAPAAPAQGATITVGDPATFPLYGHARTYSFGASAIDTSSVAPLVDATATAYGGVDLINIDNGGFGYSFPTVDFDMPEAPDGVQAKAHVASIALGDPVDGLDANGTITALVLDDPGSGYLQAPNVVIRDGTLFDPINHDPGTFGEALATATLKILSVSLETYGSGYTSAPNVVISDAIGAGGGALATAKVNAGGVTAVDLVPGSAGSGYVTGTGIRKFVDQLPGLCVPPNCPNFQTDPTAKYIPLGVPEAKIYNGVQADEYVIGVLQYRTKFSSDLPATLVRGYVQIETPGNAGISQHFPLANANVDPNLPDTPILINGEQVYAVTPPQWLGPTLVAQKNKPVRIVFHNLLPLGAEGDLFLPADSTLMGSGMGPMDMMDPVDEGTVMDMVRNPACSEYPKPASCFRDNRATLHLHGGITPWISDGTAHQWITPAGETTDWPQGVSVENVPDMNVCGANNDGCQTFYYTNQQSARLLFYHDHSWGITRLNVYAGEAAGYLITDATEQRLFGPGGSYAALGEGIPLVVQDRTFVPDAAQLAFQDPTWDVARWGSKGSFWYHHVYMPAQNPGDPGGMSAYGRWMYGPWFWPPAVDTKYGPIANPYYDPACNLDDPATWQYQTDPFCEPQQIPGTPNISVGMEQFNDTPIVNGVAYPTVTLEPKTYRFRMLNAANDRFFNFQWYVGDPNTASTGTNSKGEVIGATEVAFKADELALAQIDPNAFPTPDTSISRDGPEWYQIGTEGGFLPAPVMVDGQQVTTWIVDPTRFDVGNVDKHSLLLAPAERADVIVDFSRFAGKTLILYNDAPAAFPARVASYDYYTGAPDLSPAGAPTILPGYGPNTRTVMQVKIASSTPATAFDVTGTSNDGWGRLQTAFRHTASGAGVFEAGQHPVIVGQAAYNSAYGTNFAGSSNCNAPGSTLQRCDGLVRVSDTQAFGFNTLRAPAVKMTMPLQPKAIHDEMNATTFDEFGRMQANLGVEAQPPTPGLQNVTLYPFVNPATELIDGTNLPKQAVTYDANGLPVSDIKISPIANANDGTQIWRITHNGVDTHPIHFHLYDVQVVNRVTWDNIIIPTEPTELGWKDTVRISPLEDTIVALRPIVPQVPFELPNAIRPLNPMMPLGSQAMFNNVAPDGTPTNPVINQLVNFGWEYVYHCHILSHEEMDMMRPVTLALPPNKPDGLAFSVGAGGLTLTWNDNSINETGFLVQRNDGTGWVDLGTDPSPLDQANTHGTRSFTDATFTTTTDYQYRVVAQNTVGYGAEFPTLTVVGTSDAVLVQNPPLAPTGLAAALQAGPAVNLTWTDNATNETGFVVQRSDNGGAFVQIATPPALAGTGTTSILDSAVVAGHTYSYQVYAVNAVGASGMSNVATIVVPNAGPVPNAPTLLTATLQTSLTNGPRINLSFRDNATNETGFQVWRNDNGGGFTLLANLPARSNVGSVNYADLTVVGGHTYDYYVVAVNANGPSNPTATVNVVILPPPAAPSNFAGVAVLVGTPPTARVTLTWTDNANNESRFQIQRSTDPNFAAGTVTSVFPPANAVRLVVNNLLPGTTYYFRIQAQNQYGSSAWVTLTVTTP